MLKFTFLTLLLVLMTGWFAGITTVPEAKIIALWTFDEGQGKVVKDSSGNGNDGKITGEKWIDGGFGKALELDKDSFAEVENPCASVACGGNCAMDDQPAIVTAEAPEVSSITNARILFLTYNSKLVGIIYLIQKKNLSN